MRCIGRMVEGTMTTPMGTTHYSNADMYIEVKDSRRDEDPRHKWCSGCSTYDHLPKPHLLAHCHRCDQTYIELLHEWMEVQTPGWDRGQLNWDKVDPKRRTRENARADFENSICNGERRARERWYADA